MGTFAEALSEATQRAATCEGPASSPFADAVRAFEDRIAVATVTNVVSGAPMWVRSGGAQGAAAASRGGYVGSAVRAPARSSLALNA